MTCMITSDSSVVGASTIFARVTDGAVIQTGPAVILTIGALGARDHVGGTLGAVEAGMAPEGGQFYITLI